MNRRGRNINPKYNHLSSLYSSTLPTDFTAKEKERRKGIDKESACMTFGHLYHLIASNSCHLASYRLILSVLPSECKIGNSFSSNKREEEETTKRSKNFNGNNGICWMISSRIIVNRWVIISDLFVTSQYTTLSRFNCLVKKESNQMKITHKLEMIGSFIDHWVVPRH